MPALPTPSPDFTAQITVWAFVQHLGRPKTGRGGIQAPGMAPGRRYVGVPDAKAGGPQYASKRP